MSDKTVIWAIDSSERRYVRVEDYEKIKAERDALQNTKHYEAPRGFVLNPDYLVPELLAQRDAAVKALTELLADMALEYAGPGYDVYQVRMGAVAEAVAAIDAARGKI